MSSGERADAVRDLREALSSYQSYAHYVGLGRLLVNPGDDAEDLVVAAEINVSNCVARCRALGMSDDEMIAAVDPDVTDGGSSL